MQRRPLQRAAAAATRRKRRRPPPPPTRTPRIWRPMRAHGNLLSVLQFGSRYARTQHLHSTSKRRAGCGLVVSCGSKRAGESDRWLQTRSRFSRLVAPILASVTSIALLLVLFIALDEKSLVSITIARVAAVALTATLLALNAAATAVTSIAAPMTTTTKMTTTMAATSSVLPPALAWPPLQRLGDCSYAIYLVHWPIYIGHRMLAAHLSASGPPVGLEPTIEGLSRNANVPTKTRASK